MKRAPKSKAKPAKAMSPATPSRGPVDDPFLSIGRRATASKKGRIRHADIDGILYPQR